MSRRMGRDQAAITEVTFASRKMFRMPIRRPQHGFTLLELLVVVAIIGLLVGYVAPRYFGQVGKSEVTTAKAQIDALEKAIDQYRLDTGHYDIVSYGKDGQPGGTGENADLSNH